MKRELKNIMHHLRRYLEKYKIAVLHLSGIFFIVAAQCLAIAAIGSHVTFKGCLIFMLQVLTFYCNLYWVKPIGIIRKSYPTFVLKFLILTITYILLHRWIFIGDIITAEFWIDLLDGSYLILPILQLAFVLTISFYSRLYELSEKRRIDLLKANEKTKEALDEKLRVESVMSQLQLSPHHLFGSLNYIKVRSENENPDIAQIADLLSAILRHTLIDIRKIKKVPLSDEVDLVYSFIELHKKRSRSRVHIDYIDQFKNAGIEKEIPPSILLTLTDNVLQYAVLNDPDTPAQIYLRQESGFMIFHTFNHKRGFPLPGRGIGLKSVRTILDYYYPEHYSLEINDNEITYSLTLKIEL